MPPSQVLVVTPYLLYFRLPQCAEKILRFVQQATVERHGLGHVCVLSELDALAGRMAVRRAGRGEEYDPMTGKLVRKA